MHASSAWTVIAALARSLGRWSTLTGLPIRPVQPRAPAADVWSGSPDPHLPPMDTSHARALAAVDRTSPR